MFKKILIANRGDVAIRVLRAAQELGIKTVAVHSIVDENLMHVRLSDESVCIGPNRSADSYLNISAILSAAELTGADAIHPGVGFLSENEKFARMVNDHRITFIGPSPEHIAMMGDKIVAKKTMMDLGIPVIRGSDGAISDVDEAVRIAEEIGFPILFKAASGGGGKGMKVALNKDEVVSAMSMAKSEARANFGNDSVYMERYLANPRHIEVQILADSYGNVVHLGERDCSIQRNHQKLMEESPSPALDTKTREQIGKVVTDAVRKMGYVGVGTFEFLYENGEFFFMEMNTRLQVEHPVSEMISGIDLVKEQIKVAAGHRLSFTQDDIKFKGHAIEFRINAENSKTFMPSPGKIEELHFPGGYGVRVDSHIYRGYPIPPYYDSLIAKLIIYGDTREECLARSERALNEFVIDGVDTTIDLHKQLIQEDDIRSGNFDIHWISKNIKRLTGE